jgi:hypothetical protein
MPVIQHKQKPVTPILNNLFEFTYKGKGNNELLTETTVGYELRSDRNIIIIKYETNEEELYNLVESIKAVNIIGVLIHDRAGIGIMKMGMQAAYIGPVVKQNYNSMELFEFHAAFKIENLTTHAIKKD